MTGRRRPDSDRADATAAPCAAQLVGLLSCFATNPTDLRANTVCAQHAKELAACVATTKRGGSQGAKGSVCLYFYRTLRARPWRGRRTVAPIHAGADDGICGVAR